MTQYTIIHGITLVLESFILPHFWGFESHGKDEGNLWNQINKIR
jgi:hypothetical protein